MIKYQLISPTAITAQGKATSVGLQSVEGQLQIFPDHIPIILMLSPGIIQINFENNKSESYFSTSGYASFNENNLTIMGDQIVLFNDLSDDDKSKMIKDAKNKLSKLDKEFANLADKSMMDEKSTHYNQLISVLEKN